MRLTGTDATNLKMDSILIGDMNGDIEFIFHFHWRFRI
jgi:hypothetical protein